MFSKSLTRIQHFRKYQSVSINILFSCIMLKTASFALCSVHLTLSIFLHIYVSHACNRFSSYFCIVHVSDTYSTSCHTRVLTSHFFKLRFNFPQSSSRLILKAFFAHGHSSSDFCVAFTGLCYNTPQEAESA
jgi:hypothetical protein